MLSRGLFVALVILGAGLTGCIGGKEEPEIEAATNDSINTADPTGNKLLAFEETNATEAGKGGVDHHHDMWNGQTRLLFFQTTAAMDPYSPSVTFTAPQLNPDGTTPLVHEGTASVEFTISHPQRRVCPYGGTFDGDYVCTDNAGKVPRSYGAPVPVDGAPRADDPAPPAGLFLRYKHASTDTWIDAGELAWDTPLAIKITDPVQNDMPHATISLWEFQVESPNQQDVTLTFDMRADIVRGEGVIPLWPGHPNFYAERSSREVVNVIDWEACDQSGCTLVKDQEKTGPIPAAKLISYGTKTLHVWLNITDAQFPVPPTKPQSWFLYHNNATGKVNVTDQFDQDAYGIDKKEFYWVLPVDDGAMDSPYADASRWEFDLGAALVIPGVISCYGNCADWYAKYSLVVHATNEELPLDAYHNYCLRDEDCLYAGSGA